LARTHVLHRMIASTVAELELAGIRADSARKQLVPETDTKIGNISVERGANDIETTIEVLGISRTRRNDDAIGSQRFDIREWSAVGHDRHNGAAVDKRLHDVELDPAIDDNDVRPVAGAK